MKRLLDYNFPSDLKEMSIEEMNTLAVQIRKFLVENVSQTGGHLASNLGIVELTIAMHKFFNSPKDKFIWDVGHQSYVHKILTGRGKEFTTLRKYQGLSGFPKGCESEHDAYDTGHSSNSISVAAGFAKARDLQNEDYNVVAVIGDGSLTGGLAYEGLNNLGGSNNKAIVILNDNGMSIGQNTGGLSSHLGKVRVSQGYSDFKKGVRTAMNKIPKAGQKMYKGAVKFRDHLKYSIADPDSVMFEQLGFTYLGPIDGHNIEELLYNLSLAKESQDSVIMHIITKKGKGYKIAEQNPSKFHGISSFDINTGEVLEKSAFPGYSSVFGNKLCDLAEKDEKIVAISAAMIGGTGLSDFAKKYPDRTIDVGIAEGHAVTYAGAMAKAGIKPVVAIYSTFLQRAYDNIMIDVCLQDAPVVFALDRAGIVGADGETHHGIFDLAYLKTIPNLTVMAPANSNELERMLEYATKLGKPVALRFPRGNDGGFTLPDNPIDGKAQLISTGNDIEIWGLGNMTKTACEVADILKEKGIDCGVVNGRFLCPLDEEEIRNSAHRTKLIVTVEDGIEDGGFGSSIATYVKTNKLDVQVLNIGWDKKFIEHGSSSQLMIQYGLDADGIVERIMDYIER